MRFASMANPVEKLLMIVRVLALSVIFHFANGAQAQLAVEYLQIFRIPKAQFEGLKKQFKNLEKVSYGLSSQQMEKIGALTKGRVHFADTYSLRTWGTDSPTALKKYFQSLIYPEVPPPGFFKNGKSRGDEMLKNEWWIEKLGVVEAWELASGKEITIADCDAGFFIGESDIKPNLKLEYAWDFSDKDNSKKIDDGNFTSHGTAVTAIMAGVMDQRGTNGIAFDARVVPLQNFNYSNDDDLDKEEATAACILGAISIPDVRIIVLENQTINGSSETFVGTREAVKLALEAGITIVSAAGNNRVELRTEAANDTGSIIVGGLLRTSQKAGFSNFGKRVSIAAYAEGLKTLCHQNSEFCEFGGTSGATPQVAGTVALMLEVNPMLSPAQVKDILIKTRIETDSTRTVGGILNTLRAVQAAKEAPRNELLMLQQSKLRTEVIDILKSEF